MTRVDVALPLVSREQDGHQLQKHLLQQMEKQWLASWRDAADLSSDAASPGPSSDARPSAGDGGERGGAAVPASATRADPNPTVGPDATDPADSNATGQVAPHAVWRPRGAASGVQATAMTGMASESVVSAPSAPMAALAATVIPSTGTAGAAADAGRPPAGSVLSVAAPSALGGHALGQRAPVVVTTSPPRLDSQAEELPSPQTGRRSQRLAPPLHSAGPQRLMIRELGADLVQATLRDTQLGPVASQVAAQGLARALMEAGYARVKVVVNGRPAREASDTEGATTSTDHPFPTAKASLKDSTHGY